MRILEPREHHLTRPLGGDSGPIQPFKQLHDAAAAATVQIAVITNRSSFAVFEREKLVELCAEIEAAVSELGGARAPRHVARPPAAEADVHAAISNLQPCQREAGQSYERAIELNPRLLEETDRTAWQWNKDNDLEYDQPAFDTWAHHLRAWRHALGAQKNTPRRAQRPHGGSVVAAAMT